MKRRPFCLPLRLERLEDRNAPSETLNAVLAGINEPADIPYPGEAPPPLAVVVARR